MPKAPLADRIDQGRGLVPADLVLKGGRVFDLITGELVETDVAICVDTIVGVFGSYSGRREIDVSGRVLVPGFIDTHLHVESSLVTPHEFDRCVTPRGVTTAICDPHEIANVCGIRGIRFFLESASQLVMDLRVQLSSCVPSTHMETTGARLSAADLVPFMDHPKVIGLAEFMNYPGVLMKDPGCLEKLEDYEYPQEAIAESLKEREERSKDPERNLKKPPMKVVARKMIVRQNVEAATPITRGTTR